MVSKRLIGNIKGESRSDGIHILAIGRADERWLQQVDRLKKEGFNLLRLAKRHFGYQTDERLKPKCPFGARSLSRIMQGICAGLIRPPLSVRFWKRDKKIWKKYDRL